MVQGVSPASRPRFGTRRPARSGARFPSPSIPGCRRPTCPPSSASSSTLRTPPSFSRCTADGVCCGFARATPTAPRAASTPYVASHARWRTTARTNSPWRTPATSPEIPPGTRSRRARGVRRRRASSRCRHRRRRATPRALLRHRPRRRRRRARTHRGTHLRAVLPPRRRRARHAHVALRRLQRPIGHHPGAVRKRKTTDAAADAIPTIPTAPAPSPPRPVLAGRGEHTDHVACSGVAPPTQRS